MMAPRLVRSGESMLTVTRVDPSNRRQRDRFVDLPYRLYRGSACWVPPLRADIEGMLDVRTHPFYEHSEAAFFLAVRDGRVVGRVAALENRACNEHNAMRHANFCLFECEDDAEAAAALFDATFAWAAARGLDTIVGPKGFGAMDGYGLLVDGFEHRQTMTITNYNEPWYPRLVEASGFSKTLDYVSYSLTSPAVPTRIAAAAAAADRRGTFRTLRLSTKRDLREWAPRIGEATNRAFTGNWGYYPLTTREIDYIVAGLVRIADPRLIKVILADREIAGFVLGFRDVSAGLQRAGGRLLPFGLPAILWELRRSKCLAVGHAAILPAYQGLGGNALLYREMCRSIEEGGFERADLTQVAETNTRMQRDLVAFGATPWKRHRVYGRALDVARP
jgi:hypothetical protein